jgi:hypothetical protein
VAPPELDADEQPEEGEDVFSYARLAPHIPRALSTAKLQSYYYLRTIQIREAKRRILMNLNFFRSVKRTLTFEETRDPRAELTMEQVQGAYDSYSCTEDGLMVVTDMHGVNVVCVHATEQHPTLILVCFVW